MMEQRCSDDLSKRDIPSFIEPRPPLILNPFMRPRPEKGTNLMELFEEDSECEEPELVQVYLRMKPSTVPNNLYEVRSDHCLITSLDTAPAGHGRRTQHNVSKMYTFSRIFRPDSTQKEMFENIIKDNLRRLPEGHSFTLLTYGASGSGKTYTLMGTVQSPGLVPRSLEYLFRIVDAAQQPQYKPAEGGADKLNHAEQNYELQWVKHLRHISAPLRDKYRRMSVNLVNDMTHSTIELSPRVKHYVWVSFVEIYNEGIFDLLVPGDRRASSTLRIREDSSGNVFVKDATQAFVRSGEEAYDVMMAGKHNLQVAATGVHAHSSRSHCIFTITVLTEAEGNVRSSCARLCDLAGCERARRTRNTGARMQESRAINSSLHVLERCLHTLRRRQKRRADTHLVPYRESKLTRLLGAGLSGARGEAVSMVVTVNPAPEFAHETKHVLQMAAVAKDIQINNTIAESSMDSVSIQDSTIMSSAEVVRLRSENERLHFELEQAQARNRELMAIMEDKLQQSASMMTELVEEAKDMTRQYYEAQLQALRDQMEDLKDEYESRKSLTPVKPARTSATPDKKLQNKIAQLMTEKAILEDKLAAEQIAKNSAEQEVQYLLGCIEERDENNRNASPVTNDEGVMSLSDSEDENDICNESLEPRFKKEDINRSRLLLRQSLMNNTKSFINQTIDRAINNESLVETLNDTVKDNDSTLDGQDSTSADDTEDHSNKNTNHISSKEKSNKDLAQESEIVHKSLLNNTSSLDISETICTPVTVKKRDSLIRGTYFVRKSQDISDNDSFDDNMNNKPNKSGTILEPYDSVLEPNDSVLKPYDSVLEPNDSVLKPYDSVLDASDKRKDESKNTSGVEKHLPEDSFEEKSLNYTPPAVSEQKTPQTVVSKLIDSVKPSSIDTSLDQFEKYEMAAKTCNIDNESSFKRNKGKKTYFDDGIESTMKDPKKGEVLKIQDEKAEKKYETVFTKIAKNKMTLYANNSNEVQDNTNIDTEVKAKDKTSHCDDSINAKDNDKVNFQNDLGKEAVSPKQDDATKLVDHNNLVDVDKIIKSKGKKTYFDDLDTNNQIKTTKDSKIDQIKNATNDDRSPSIVKEEATTNVELSTIKKLLGDTTIRQTSVYKNQVSKAKLNSIDLFESPLIPVKAKEALDIVNKSVEELSLEDKSINKTIKVPSIIVEPPTPATLLMNEADVDDDLSKNNNTFEDFENIYNNVTAPRATEFEMLISGSSFNETNNKTLNKESKKEEAATKYNLRKTQTKAEPEKNDQKKNQIDVLKEKFEKFTSDKIETKKYKLRSLISDEVLLEASAKCESKPTKRNLRLRRRKNRSEEETDIFLGNIKNNIADIQCNEENPEKSSEDKLKNIVNLQTEFSDVTMDVPAPIKDVKDIPSPEKNSEEYENMPPLCAQSCPAKSITRSRRKLFTPRAEPFEESLTHSESNEKVHVPRPSYHRPRARRKL